MCFHFVTRTDLFSLWFISGSVIHKGLAFQYSADFPTTFHRIMELELKKVRPYKVMSPVASYYLEVRPLHW